MPWSLAGGNARRPVAGMSVRGHAAGAQWRPSSWRRWYMGPAFWRSRHHLIPHQISMQTFRFSDEATSEKVTASTGSAAVKKYLKNYDTGDMSAGEAFQARLFAGTVVTVEADGKGRVKSHSISAK